MKPMTRPKGKPPTRSKGKPIRLDQLQGELRRQLRERPYWTSAVLVGMGWVVGRALPLRALFAVAGFGARTALLSTIEGAMVDQMRSHLNGKEAPR